MKTAHIAIASIAIAAPALAGACCTTSVYHPATASARDQLLATPAPRYTNRTTTHTNNHANLWIPEGTYTTPASRYGADMYSAPRVIYARRDHKVIALSPWCDVRGNSRIGFDDLDRARNQWLREHGYVLSVRTHVNPRHLQSEQHASANLPTPRATIKRNIEKRTPEVPMAYIGATTTDQIRARLAAEAKLADAN